MVVFFTSGTLIARSRVGADMAHISQLTGIVPTLNKDPEDSKALLGMEFDRSTTR